MELGQKNTRCESLRALLPYVEWDRFVTLAGSKSGLRVTLSYLTLHLRGDYHDIVTHDRSREFRMHMKNSAHTGSGCIRFNDLKIKQATFADILVQCVWGGARYVYLNVVVVKRNISGV